MHPTIWGIILPMECKHSSDCAVHNAPAYPVGECDCAVRFQRKFVSCGCLAECNRDANPETLPLSATPEFPPDETTANLC